MEYNIGLDVTCVPGVIRCWRRQQNRLPRLPKGEVDPHVREKVGLFLPSSFASSFPPSQPCPQRGFQRTNSRCLVPLGLKDCCLQRHSPQDSRLSGGGEEESKTPCQPPPKTKKS